MRCGGVALFSISLSRRLMRTAIGPSPWVAGAALRPSQVGLGRLAHLL